MTQLTFQRCIHLIFLIAILLFLPAFGQYVQQEKFANEQDRRARYELDDWISHSTSHSFSGATIGTHYLYIATKDGGILRYHILENYWDFPFTTSSGLPSNTVLDVYYDPETGFLWAITPNDISIFQPASKEWISKSETPGWPYDSPERDSSGIRPRKNDQINRGVFFNRDALLNLPTFFANGSFSILSDWRLSDDNTFDEYLMVGYIRDRFDRIWFLVDGFGIGQGDMFSQRADFYRIGLPDISPRAIEFQGDDLWIGGVGDRRGISGIALWPYNSAEWEHFQAKRIARLPSDNVFSMLADGDSIWFASDFGVSLFDYGDLNWKNYSTREGMASNEVNDLAIVNDYLYAATQQGISRISLLTGNLEKTKDKRFINLPVYRFALQSDTLWAGTLRGIFRRLPDAAEWEFVPSRASIQDLEITAVGTFEDEIWFASTGGITLYEQKSDKWQSFPQLAFEIFPPYSDIKVNESAAWVATDSGLLKYDKLRGYWRLFTTEDGLLDNRCHQLLLDGDFIWIVTDKGITEFYWNSPQRSD